MVNKYDSFGRIKCKNYFIIKLRYYASPYYMKKFRNGDPIANKKHYEASVNFNEFSRKFIEIVSERPYNYYEREYFLNSKECAYEDIHESHGIIFDQAKAYYVLMIPKEYTDIINWVKNNVNIPFKIVKKTELGFCDFRPTTWKREEYKTTDEIKEMLKK